MSRVQLSVCLAGLAWPPACASAHYLWITSDGGKAVVVFEESVRPGDGRYLAPVAERATVWARSATDPAPKAVKLTAAARGKKRWLTAPLPGGKSRAVEAYVKWGVYRYGKTDVLLHYYTRHLDAADYAGLMKLSRAEHLALDLEVVPSPAGLAVRLLWKGKPVAGRRVSIRGPGKYRDSPTTGKTGMADLEKSTPGLYTLRAAVEEPGRAGEFKGKKYVKVRHNVTMTLRLPAVAGGRKRP